MSLNHKDIENIKLKRAIKNKYPVAKNPCIINTPTVVRTKSAPLVEIGHGEGDTI